MTDSQAQAGLKIGPIQLAPGITRVNFAALVYASIAANTLMSFINLIQPLILEEVLQIPGDRQGTVSGNLTFVSELAALLLLGYFGALSDKTGRRPIVVFGYVMLGVGYLLYPFMPDEYTLYASRAVFAIGVAAVSGMMATILNDYPAEQSRGKMMAIGGVASGAGGILMMAVAQLPSLFEKGGMTTPQAIQATLLSVFAACCVTALLLRMFLSPAQAVTTAEDPPLLTKLQQGVTAMRQPRISIAYASAFVARSDFVVVGTFFFLWYVQSASEAGMSSADATGRAGIIFAVMQVSALLSAPFVGVLIDRIDRLTALAICMAVVAIGYSGMGLVADPLSPIIWVAAVAVGIGMMSGFLASQALVGEAAAPKIRGSIIGLFGLSGAVGILFVTSTGGYIYDNWLRSGPFLLSGALATLIVISAILVRRRESRRAQSKEIEK